jgi:hypothetical protein
LGCDATGQRVEQRAFAYVRQADDSGFHRISFWEGTGLEIRTFEQQMHVLKTRVSSQLACYRRSASIRRPRQRERVLLRRVRRHRISLCPEVLI